MQYALALSAVIERGCSIGTNHAENCLAYEFRSDDTRRRTIPRQIIISDIRNAPLYNSIIDAVSCFCLEATASLNGGNFAVIGALLWWRPPVSQGSGLPPERLMAFFFASAY